MEYFDAMINRLDNWVREQKRIIEEFKKYGEYAQSTNDRLTLLLSSQAMLAYIERTLKDFESWLSNPMITSLMPIEMLKKLEERLRQIATEFIEIDIEHSSEYRDMLTKLRDKDLIPEILKLYFIQKVPTQQRRRGEGREVPRFF